MSYEISKAILPDFIRDLQKKMKVFVPAIKPDGAGNFQEFAGQELFLEKNTDFSPKKLFLPPFDKLFEFRKKNLSYSIEQNLDNGQMRAFLEKPREKMLAQRAVFGIRPCDIHALLVLDKVMIEYYKEDPWYETKRKNTLLFGIQCSSSCSENCFCESMGTSTVKEGQFDLMFYDAGEKFFVEAGSEAGRKILKESSFFRETNSRKPYARPKISKKFDAEGLPLLLSKSSSHRVWEREAERCLSCTSCTQVCPTCYCFFTEDFPKLGSDDSSRERVLDSCQLKRHTMIAGGHVFRESRKERLMQFVRHKFEYFFDRHSVQLCVGCGRCINICPVKIDLTFIADEIRGKAFSFEKNKALGKENYKALGVRGAVKIPIPAQVGNESKKKISKHAVKAAKQARAAKPKKTGKPKQKKAPLKKKGKR
jgi:ferredoxin